MTPCVSGPAITRLSCSRSRSYLRSARLNLAGSSANPFGLPGLSEARGRHSSIHYRAPVASAIPMPIGRRLLTWPRRQTRCPSARGPLVAAAVALNFSQNSLPLSLSLWSCHGDARPNLAGLALSPSIQGEPAEGREFGSGSKSGAASAMEPFEAGLDGRAAQKAHTVAAAAAKTPAPHRPPFASNERHGQ